MSRYLLINLVILAGPLLFSFWRPVRYYRRWPALLFAIATAGTVYIVWDIWVTAIGHWGFNPKYLLGIKFLTLPIEEYMFFITAPFSCIFIYEVLRAKSRERLVGFPRGAALAAAALLFAGSVVFFGQGYTRLALASCGLFFLAAAFLGRRQLASSHYWLYILISFIPFLIFNHLLTATPIVTYNPAVIWGIRIISIPLEDFFYNFSMLSFYLMAYLAVRKKD